jgi:hypothetical protein
MADYVSFCTKFFGDFGPSLDFVEKGGGRVLKKIGEQIKAAAMRHSKNYMLNTA